MASTVSSQPLPKVLQAGQGLRNLYFVRALFSAVWVTSMFLVGIPKPEIGAWLLVVYPAWDVLATLVELRVQADTRAQFAHYLNLASSLLATIGFGLALQSELSTRIILFGIWALVAGLIQLAVGLMRRRQLSGQWPIIASGAQSSLAGIAFILIAHSPTMGLASLAGYSAVGAIYFLISAIRMTLRSRASVAGKADS